jgi:hypothetical protein
LLGSIVLIGASAMYGVGVATALSAVLIIISAAMIVIGVMGVRYRARPDKAKSLMIIGIVLIIIEAVALAMNITAGSNPASAIGGIILGLLYIVGTNMNRSR